MEKISRRTILKSSAVLAGMHLLEGTASAVDPKLHIAVIGAGAFGGWTALYLLRRGAQVTLLDAWGPGNSRASSGGETRVIRATYGGNRIYTQMAIRALQLWKEHESKWQHPFYTRTGALWMVTGEGEYEKASIPLLDEAKFGYQKLTTDEAAKKYPQINFEGVHWALFEEEAGFLFARQGCETVLQNFTKEGGKYIQSNVKPGAITNNNMNSIELSDGTKLQAAKFVFACGPWLGKVFPEVIGNLIHPTRQDVFFFGTPAGDDRFDEKHFPVWVDHGKALIYGIPGNKWRGFKVADDTRGPDFDPTDGKRIPTENALKVARDLLALRFPALKDSPVVESRVCQYENSPDSNFIMDRHPEAKNVWVAGGGSGHGYKMGPAFGEMMSDLVLSEKSPEPIFSLSRFKK
ncbi:MAG TPA: FAD-dependent oxidoreductase [Acidobacteriota bacterium]|nr:FAD-dependent oxidoreductase [Acidobacteriota bacterium]